ncbi:MAG: 2OG-Fe(II) oxygenase [Rhizomicrobium sp.]
MSASSSIAERVNRLHWEFIGGELNSYGCAVLPRLLDPPECLSVSRLYDIGSSFRSRIVMARHNFGSGEYKYLSYPLPPLVAELRASLYPHLARVANHWAAAPGADESFPPDLESYLAKCHAAGQTRPTPLLLKYETGDYNCLHQDIYGEHAFPLQAAILLSRPNADFSGGELVLTEQRPRMQSRVEVVPLDQGDAVVFPVHHRPVNGRRGIYRATMRHGVSRIRSGRRCTLGIIFHDAK